VKNIVFDFESVIGLIDYFGLIKIMPEYSFCQSDEDGNRTYCFEKGKSIQIDGRQALAYMRARKNLPNGDFDRVKNQRQILKIILNEFLKLGLVEKIKFYYYVKKVLNTDIELRDLNIRKLINVQQILLDEYTLKGEDYINTYYYYKLDLQYLEKIKKYYI
jgi:anionic cell wall polymer biosynthesis LytR-Cps2A-Psr (LCP) family protein